MIAHRASDKKKLANSRRDSFVTRRCHKNVRIKKDNFSTSGDAKGDGRSMTIDDIFARDTG
jgi:hypothetical protein